jgi:hypothetical protein
VNDRANGEFDVKLVPEPADFDGIARATLDKVFHGDLEATSRGLMLSTAGSVLGSAAYVAIERVRGTLKGRTGEFTLQHTGVADRGRTALTVTVVPDSGTEDLAGLSGRLDIVIDGKKHFYTFDYEVGS